MLTWRLDTCRHSANPCPAFLVVITYARLVVVNWTFHVSIWLATYGGRAFAYAGPTSWNSLPDSLNDINLTLQTFKRHLMTFLFSTYYALYKSTVIIIITGSIARSASHQYLVYSEADFEVFRPVGATRCTDVDNIWHGGGDQSSPPPCHISPPSVQQQGRRTPKTEIFTQI